MTAFSSLAMSSFDGAVLASRTARTARRSTRRADAPFSGWQPTGAILGTDFYIKVRGAANMDIEWATTVTFTQIKTGVAL